MRAAYKIGLILLAAPPAAGRTCNIEKGFVVGTSSLSQQGADDAEQCCSLCYSFDGCIAFTFEADSKTCFLKDNVFNRSSKAEASSGTFASRTFATRACSIPGHTDYPFCNTKLSIDSRIDDLISRLTLQEKPPMLTARESPKGGVPRLGVPEYDWGANCIHGVQSRCGDRCPTSFPNPNAQGASFNRTLWKAMAQVTGVELRALWLADIGEYHDNNLPHLGLDCWSPNININRDPRWGRNLETPGEDPYLNGQYGVWHTEGLQEGEDKRYLQAVVTLKHFDAYSLEDAGGGEGAPTRHNFNAVVSNTDLAGTYFPAFKATVREGKAKGVMCSYNALNGVPSCANKFLLQDVLRDTWNFNGYVSSDSGAVQDIFENHKYKNMTATQGVAAAVKAGCDIDSGNGGPVGHWGQDSPYVKDLIQSVKEGLITEADVNVLLKHSLRMRFELGLFDPIEDQPYWHYSVKDKVDTPAAQELNREATREGLVLLKNSFHAHWAHALPRQPGKGKVAVLGPHANAQSALVGNYLGQICPTGFGNFHCVESPAAAIARVNGGSNTTVVVEGCSISGNSTEGFKAALEAISDSSVTAVVMMMGLDVHEIEKEGHDRTDLGLPGVQLQLVQEVVKAAKDKKPVIVVLINGGPIAIDWLKPEDQTDAILEAFYPGKLGAAAITDAIFGAFSPSGKMPYTVFPASYSQEVDFLDMSMTAGTGRTYRFYEGTPLWPFGYGLSYSRFTLKSHTAFENVTLPTAFGDKEVPTFEVEVTNEGPMDADEVVQAYWVLTDVDCKHPAAWPKQQLFDFKRVSLAIGESTFIKFDVPSASLALADLKGDLVNCPSRYNLVFTDGVYQKIVHTIQLTGAEQILEPFPKQKPDAPSASTELFV